MVPTHLTFNAGTSAIRLVGNSKTFAGGGMSYNKVELQGNLITVTGSNAFGDLEIKAGNTANMTAGTTQNISTLHSDQAGSPATVSCASGTVTVQNANIQDITASGGATFRAYDSLNVSGNTGWIFGYAETLQANMATSDLLADIQSYEQLLETNASVGFLLNDIQHYLAEILLSSLIPETVQIDVQCYLPESFIAIVGATVISTDYQNYTDSILLPITEASLLLDYQHFSEIPKTDIGLSALGTDLQKYTGNALLSLITETSSLLDCQHFSEKPIITSVLSSSEADIQKYAESLLSSLISDISQLDVQQYLPEIAITVAGITVIPADYQNYTENALLSSIAKSISLLDFQCYFEDVKSGITASFSLTEIQYYVDVVLFNINGLAKISDVQYYNAEELTSNTTSLSLAIDFQHFIIVIFTFQLTIPDEIAFQVIVPDEITYQLTVPDEIAYTLKIGGD